MECPSISDDAFDWLLSDTAYAAQHRTDLLDGLHQFLNELSCFGDLPQWLSAIRHKRFMRKHPFDPPVNDEDGWFMRQHGGRNEAQLNLGLKKSYLRVGIGFEFTNAGWGEPERVLATFGHFREVIREREREFRDLARTCSLSLEFLDKYEPGSDAVTDWLLRHSVGELTEEDPDDTEGWIFVGRILRRGRDRDTLEDSARLGELISRVFEGLLPIWRETTERGAQGC